MHPSIKAQILALQHRAEWHLQESNNYLRYSASAMRQHEREASDLFKQIKALEEQSKATKEQV